MKANVIKLMIFATLGLLLRDSATCAGGNGDANTFLHTQKKVLIPSGPGEPFEIDKEIFGGIPDNERQILTKDFNDEDWSSRTLTLPDLIDEALKRNPTTRQFWEAANASAASLAAAKGAYWPTATFTGGVKPSFARADRFQQSSPAGETRTLSVDYFPTLQVQYLLFDFGGRQAGVDAARFSLLASEFAINQTLQTVALGVLKSYYTLLQATENVHTAEESLSNAEDEMAKIGTVERDFLDKQAKFEKSKDDSSKVLEFLQKTLPTLGNQFIAMPADQQLAAANAFITKTTESFVIQKKLTEPNVAAAQFNLAVAHGALANAKIQLATSIGLPGNTKVNVALPRSSWFSPEDFLDVATLVHKLVFRMDPLSVYLWNQLSDEGQKIFRQSDATLKDERDQLVEEFNEVLRGGISLYESNRFAGIDLRPETVELVEQQRREEGLHGYKLQRLNRLLLEDAYPLELRKGPPPDPPPLESLPVAIDKMIEMALRRRPDIANKYVSYQSAQAVARQANSNIYPTLTASFIGSTTETNKKVWVDDPAAPSHTHTVGRSDSLVGVLSVNIPVFDALTLVNKARAARSTAKAAKADLANTELNAIADVATNFKTYEWAVKQYKAAEIVVDRAMVAFNEALQAYTNAQTPGERDANLSLLLPTQTSLDNAAKSLSQTKLNLFTSSFQLANATGALLPAVVNTDPSKRVPSVSSIPGVSQSTNNR